MVLTLHVQTLVQRLQSLGEAEACLLFLTLSLQVSFRVSTNDLTVFSPQRCSERLQREARGALVDELKFFPDFCFGCDSTPYNLDYSRRQGVDWGNGCHGKKCYYD